MRNWVRVVFTFALCSLAVLAGNLQAANAATTTKQNQFSVTPMLPSNQLKTEHAGFSLNIHPQHQQTITVVIANLTNHRLELRQGISNATTKQNGGILLTPAPKAVNDKFDDSLQYPLAKSMRLNQHSRLSLPAHQRIEVSATFVGNIDLRFTGLVLGGWYFTRVDAKNVDTQVVPIGLHITKHVQPALGLQHIDIDGKHHQMQLAAHLQNDQPAVLHAQINAEIIDEHKKVISAVQYSDVAIAPNSNFKLDLLKNKAIKRGRYTLVLTALAPKTHQQWHFERQIVLHQDKQNHEVADVKQPFPFGLVIGGGVVLLGIIGGIFWWYRRK